VRNLASLKWDGNCRKKTKKTQLEKGLDTGEMSVFLCWKHVHPLVSLKACTHLRNWEPEIQRDGVGMYSRGKGAASRVQDRAGRNIYPMIPIFKNVLLTAKVRKEDGFITLDNFERKSQKCNAEYM